VRRNSERQAASRGFTLIELMAVVVVVGTLAAFAVVRSKYTIDQARVARATGDIRAILVDVMAYSAASSSQALPLSLSDIDRAGMLDPWGRPYVYVNFKLGGSPRTDVFGVDLNSQFDVYSMGEDGASSPSLTAGSSLDDVVLGMDGGFIGKATRY
jgi:general secretion pathway protein G